MLILPNPYPAGQRRTSVRRSSACRRRPRSSVCGFFFTPLSCPASPLCRRRGAPVSLDAVDSGTRCVAVRWAAALRGVALWTLSCSKAPVVVFIEARSGLGSAASGRPGDRWAWACRCQGSDTAAAFWAPAVVGLLPRAVREGVWFTCGPPSALLRCCAAAGPSGGLVRSRHAHVPNGAMCPHAPPGGASSSRGTRARTALDSGCLGPDGSTQSQCRGRLKPIAGFTCG
jgi:hypothetical protein